MVSKGRFPRRSRLSAATQFREIFTGGRRHKNFFFTTVVKRNGLSHARLGLAVSKRKLRLSVHRNDLKRLIRESFRLNQACLSGLDVVVIPNAGVTAADSRVLRAALQKLWKEIQHERPRRG